MSDIRLKYTCLILNGYAFKSDLFEQHGIPVVRQSSLKTGKIVFDGVCYPPELTPDRFLLKDGDICIGLSGSIENFGLVSSDQLPAALNQRVAALRPKTRLTLPRFLFYFVQSSIFRDQISRSLPSTTIANIDAGLLGNIRIPYLDREAQKAIAKFLECETARIDQLIEKRARFAELVLQRREAMIAQSVVGSSNDDGGWLSDLPEAWKAERAKFHFRETQDRSDTGHEELLTVSHITGVTRRSEKDVNMFLAESNEGYKLVAPGDLIINTMWAWMGAMGVSSENGLISPSYGVYQPISAELRPDFVDLMVRSRPFVAEATRRSKGIHSSRLRLYPDAFLDMLLPIPPLHVQDSILIQIATRAGNEDALLGKNRRAEELLREFRAALISAAVTGQIDVKAWGNEGQTDRRLDQIEEEMTQRTTTA